MSKFKKKKKKVKEGLKRNLDAEVFLLAHELGQGLTLDQVARDRDMYYSDLMTEINSEPRLKQAVLDGKSRGKAHWQDEMIRLMTKRNVNVAIVRDWVGNYMDWWSRPLPKEFTDNATVYITVVEHIPNKKQQKLIDQNT